MEKITSMCRDLLNKGDGTIQQIASVVGLMKSYAKAVLYGDNHTKRLEINKVNPTDPKESI